MSLLWSNVEVTFSHTENLSTALASLSSAFTAAFAPVHESIVFKVRQSFLEGVDVLRGRL